MQKEIEILCLEHNEKIVSFSLDSQPKCQKCLPKNDLTVEQFVEIVDQQRKKKISSIQQEQSASQKYFAQIKKQLLINKEIYVQGINKLISLIEKQMQQIQIDMQGQITELSKPIQSLQTSKLKEYFKNNDSIRTDNLFGKKISEIQFALNKEYKQLQRETGITNILYRMGDMNNPLFLNDYRVCVPGEQNSEPANIKTIPSGGYTRQDFMPLYTFCPNQESCADNRTAQWYKSLKTQIPNIFDINFTTNNEFYFLRGFQFYQSQAESQNKTSLMVAMPSKKKQIYLVRYHQFCGSPLYLNIYGDVFCKNYKKQEECTGFSIQHAIFLCQKSNFYQAFSSPGEFLSSIQYCLLNDQTNFNLSIKSQKTLYLEVLRRWIR